jgi:hypothetical protein
MSRPSPHPLAAVLCVSLLFLLCPLASVTNAADKGNDLHYALTRVDDADPAVRQEVFRVCRMASADGVKIIQQALAAPNSQISADSRKQLQHIVQQQSAVRQHMQSAWEARNFWLLHSTTLAFDRFSTHNPAWDQTARDAIDFEAKPDRPILAKRLYRLRRCHR